MVTVAATIVKCRKRRGTMPERSSTPSMADLQRQWQEMAEAAVRPWQDVAEVFAQPWRELADSFSSNADLSKLGQQAWDIITSSYTALAEEQERIAEAIFEAMRNGADEMRRAMEPFVDQLSSFGQSVMNRGGAEPPTAPTATPGGKTETLEATAAATKVPKPGGEAKKAGPAKKASAKMPPASTATKATKAVKAKKVSKAKKAGPF